MPDLSQYFHLDPPHYLADSIYLVTLDTFGFYETYGRHLDTDRRWISEYQRTWTKDIRLSDDQGEGLQFIRVSGPYITKLPIVLLLIT